MNSRRGGFFGGNKPCSFIPDRNGKMILCGELIFGTFSVEFVVDTSIMPIDSGFLLKYAKRWINVLPRRNDVDHRIMINDKLGNCRIPENPFLKVTFAGCRGYLEPINSGRYCCDVHPNSALTRTLDSNTYQTPRLGKLSFLGVDPSCPEVLSTVKLYNNIDKEAIQNIASKIANKQAFVTDRFEHGTLWDLRMEAEYGCAAFHDR